MFILQSACTCFGAPFTGNSQERYYLTDTYHQESNLFKLSSNLYQRDRQRISNVWTLFFQILFSNSFLLKAPCRCGSGWPFPESLLFFKDSNAYMITSAPGFLKDQCDLHQGGTAVCPLRVSCVLLLKKVTLQKRNVLKVKSFPLYPSIHKVENNQTVAPKRSFKQM